MKFSIISAILQTQNLSSVWSVIGRQQRTANYILEEKLEFLVSRPNYFFNMALYVRTFASTQAISFSDLSNILWHINLTQNQNMIGYRKSHFTYHLRLLRSNRPQTILFCWWTLARSPRRTQGESLLLSSATYISNIANSFMMNI